LSAALLTAGVVFLGEFAMAQPPTVRIGYVDVQRVLARSSSGVAAREQLEREKASKQKELEARRTEADKLREELEKKGALLSQEARREKQEAMDRKVRDLRRLADDYQRELEKKEQGLVQQALQEIGGVIERVGKQRGYLIIFERRGAGVIYGAPEVDMTDEIIKVYDQETVKRKK
jgi:outer membrane protein